MIMPVFPFSGPWGRRIVTFTFWLGLWDRRTFQLSGLHCTSEQPPNLVTLWGRVLVADVPQEAVHERGLAGVHAANDIHPLGILQAMYRQETNLHVKTLNLHIHLCLHLCLHVHLCVCIHMHIFYLSLHLLYVCVYVYLFIYTYVYV